MDTHSYYLLLDNDTSRVSIAWKGIQLICLLSIGLSGFWAAFCMGRLTLDFGNNCFLYAHLEFLTNDTDLATMRKTYPLLADHLPAASAINLRTTEWGKKSMCYFCQFTPLMSSIYALIWFALFLLCTRGGVGYISDTFSRPWRIVYPALIFGAISAIVMFVSAIHITNGSQEFCTQFVKRWNSTSCFNDIDKYTIYFSGRKATFFANLIASVTSSHICCVSWLLYVLILSLRIMCIADFQMVKVEVMHSTSSKQCLTYTPSSTPQPKQILMATPESISDDVEKQAGKGDRDFTLQDSDKTSLKDEPAHLQSQKQKYSPSLNFADDSPFNEDNKSISLVPLTKKPDDLGSNENRDELAWRAPRIDFSNL
ncbi:hypothetical protein PPYR_01974 [Photinus pyralis]|uniref:Uncharacterized protein n=1 Tax=Photinus pyralis TaxID=7054 RepID=A0A1Y1MQJ5_PHOPY|nr:uncharacterized protein LOC116167159 [Photinus pyralis]KAB0805004.1 hypothetical protein PPYR_01974 [Photinus pyralis]